MLSLCSHCKFVGNGTKIIEIEGQEKAVTHCHKCGIYIFCTKVPPPPHSPSPMLFESRKWSEPGGFGTLKAGGRSVRDTSVSPAMLVAVSVGQAGV